MVGRYLKLLLRVSSWEFGEWMDSDRDVLRVGMGPTAVISRQQYSCSFQPRKSLSVWLVSDGMFQGHVKSTISRSGIIEASPRGHRWL